MGVARTRRPAGGATVPGHGDRRERGRAGGLRKHTTLSTAFGAGRRPRHGRGPAARRRRASSPTAPTPAANSKSEAGSGTGGASGPEGDTLNEADPLVPARV